MDRWEFSPRDHSGYIDVTNMSASAADEEIARQVDAERQHVEAAKDIAGWTGAIFDEQRRRDAADRGAYRRDDAHQADYQRYLDSLNTNSDHHGAFRRPNP